MFSKNYCYVFLENESNVHASKKPYFKMNYISVTCKTIQVVVGTRHKGNDIVHLKKFDKNIGPILHADFWSIGIPRGMKYCKWLLSSILGDHYKE